MGLVLDSLTGKVARSNIRRATQLHCRNSCRYRMSSPAGSKRKRQNQLVSPVMVAAQEAPPKATQELKLRTFDSKSLDKAQLSNILTRPRIDFDSILHTVNACSNCRRSRKFPSDMSSTSQVQPIVQAVKERGDQAVRQFTEKFDRVQLDVVCSPIEVRVQPYVFILCCSTFNLRNVLDSAVCIRTFQNQNFQQIQLQPLKQLSTTSTGSIQHRSKPFPYKWRPCLACNVDVYPKQ